MINTKLKKAMAVTLVSAMAVSSLAACSSSSNAGATDGSTEGNKATEGNTDAADNTTAAGGDTEKAKIEAPSTEGWDDSKKIYVYLWDADGQNKVTNIINQMGDAGKYVEIVNINCGGQDQAYKDAVNNALDGGDKYPSVILADESIAKLWSETDKTLDLGTIGITSDMTSDMYSYTVDYGTYNGALKAVSWQATPGCLVYRADIAKEVFGTDDPDEVGALLSDWDKFMDAAEKLKEKNYKIVSGTNEIKYSVLNQRANAWLDIAADGSETLKLDSTLETYIEKAKVLYDNEYTNQANAWETPWSGSMAEGDVFCYFGCTWFIGTMEQNVAKDAENFGQWRTTTAPESFYWGGTYMSVGAETPNPELAAYFVYMMTCDNDAMYNLAKDTGDFVNNKTTVDKLVADGIGARDILGGQNPYATFSKAAASVNSKATYIDGSILGYVDDASKAYNAGTYKTVEEAIQYIKDQVAKDFDYIAQ